MNKLKFVTISIIMLLLLSMASPSMNVFAGPLAATSPTLGAAGSYSVLGAETVTNTGSTTMTGDLGTSPGSALVGFPPGIVGPPGVIRSVPEAALAQLDNTAAFTTIDQPCTQTYAGVQDLTLVSPLGPGVYCADAFLITGNLTLSGSGVWIFKSASTLTTSTGSSVTGGDPCNVWWRLVSSGSQLGPNASLIGNILASTSIAMQTGSSLNGRLLVQTGSVTLDANTIFGPVCAAAPTAVPEETVTKKVKALPNTGGAPIRDDSFPWSLALIGGIGAAALVLGVRKYLRTNK
jgi:hypothetical protein